MNGGIFISKFIFGKYKVLPISNSSSSFNYLKSSKSKNHFENGVYIYLSRPIMVELIKTDGNIGDFYFPNGGFLGKRYEFIILYWK